MRLEDFQRVPFHGFLLASLMRLSAIILSQLWFEGTRINKFHIVWNGSGSVLHCIMGCPLELSMNHTFVE